MIQIPTLSELYNGILADLEAEFNISIPLFGKNFLRAIAAVQAAKLKIAYLYIGKVQKNIFIDTADPESQGGTLERFGRVKLQRGPFKATSGQYTVQVTGTTGAVINASTTFKSNDGSLNPGKLFILDQEFILDGINIITLRALEAGLDSQLSIGDELDATSPIALVDSTVTVLTESIEPIAAEDIEDYRQKGIQAYQLEPQGGSGADYRLWCADVQGVEQSYPFAAYGASNEVDLFIEATLIDSSDGKGTPTSAILTAVEESIELPTVERPSRKPLGVYAVNYLPITPLDIDIQITSYVGLTSEKEALILSAMNDELSNIRPFVSSIDVLANRNDLFDSNKIVQIISNAVPGSVFGAVQLTVDSSIVSSYTFENGEIPYLNSITYV